MSVRGAAASRSPTATTRTRPSAWNLIVALLVVTTLAAARPAEAAPSRCPNGPDNAVQVSVSATTCAEARRVVRAWSGTCIALMLGDGARSCAVRTSTRRYRCSHWMSRTTGRVHARCAGSSGRAIVRFKFYVGDQGPDGG